MGNRFRGLDQYHTLVKAHGVLAAIVFLVIIPIAIMLMRFPGKRRLHAWLQILAVLISTVVFALGFFAVGPERSLTNPHHGIGVAIYVLILVQAFGGILIRHSSMMEKLTIKVMVRFTVSTPLYRVVH